LQVLLNIIPDRIFFKDTQSRFIQCNQAFARLLGVDDPTAAVGKTEYDFLPADRAKESYQDEQKIIRNGQPLINKVEKQTAPDGKVTWASVTKLPVRDPAGVMMGIAGIARDITDLKRTENELEQMHKQLVETSRMAGKAEVATGVLHNVANVINSVNVAAATVSERLRNSKVAGVSRLAKLFQEQSNDLGHFFTEDERGRRVPAYLEQLAEHLEQEQADLGKELEGLLHNVEHIKEIVTTQQNYERVAGVTEKVAPADLVEDALRIHGGAYERHGVTVVREFDPLPPILVDKHKVLQILVNLFSNAKYACEEGGNKTKQVTVRIRAAGEDRLVFEVADNGMGIPLENQGRVFSQGFTTRKDGHGFGLHSGAVAAQDLGGSLTVQSAGPGQGATFTLELPVKPPADQPN
jgi:PAS domain S-box-containing protein